MSFLQRRGVPVTNVKERWIRAVALVTVLIGAFFRVYHLDTKVYWDDEVYSGLKIAGYTELEADHAAANARHAGELQAILHPPKGRRTKTALDTARALAEDEPQHPPLYYMLAHEWTGTFGNSIQSVRAVSATAALIALPCFFWLCLELFRSMGAAWIGVALFALSPVQVLYAQEAREYALWSAVILAVSAALLRALRKETVEAWGLYALLLALSLYVYPLSALVGVAHMAYVAVTARHTIGMRLRYAACAFVAGFLAFLPWLIIILERHTQVSRSMATVLTAKTSLFDVVKWSLRMPRLDLIDFNLERHVATNLALSLPALALLTYAFFFLWRAKGTSAPLFITSLTVVTAVPIIVLDVISSGQRTGQTRYFIPMYLALNLAFVYLFAAKILQPAGGLRARRLWTMAFAGVLALRGASCAVSAEASTWWNKLDQKSITVAAAVNRARRPLLLTDNYLGYALSLGEYLAPDVAVKLAPRCYLCAAAESIKEQPLDRMSLLSHTIFLLGPSTRLLADVSASAQPYQCIDVRSNCFSDLTLW